MGTANTPLPARTGAVRPNSFLRAFVLASCQEHGPHLNVPQGIDGKKLMAAIAQVESGLGANCGPRHEPGYDIGGAVYQGSKEQQALVAKFPAPADSPRKLSPAACSYGPWQMMLVNFSQDTTPQELETDLEKCATAFCEMFNSYVIKTRGAKTLDEIGEVWNAGHVTPDPAYTTKLQAAYAAQS